MDELHLPVRHEAAIFGVDSGKNHQLTTVETRVGVLDRLDLNVEGDCDEDNKADGSCEH